jgi:hypothetical protein
MGIFNKFKSNVMESFISNLIIVLIGLVVGIAAHYICKTADCPLEDSAEAIVDYELGLPPGTVDFEKHKEIK